MSVFATDTEVYEAIAAMFDEALTHPDIGPELAASGVILHLALSEPTTDIVIDMPGGVAHRGKPADVTPTMTLKAKADVAHEYWLGNVNVGVAIARGAIRVRGSVPTLVRLAGMAKPLFPLYRARVAPEAS